MAYKSLLTILTHPDQLETALAAAIEMARQQDAHLEVLCLGVDQTQAGYFYAGTSGVAIQAMLDAAQDHANTLEVAARTRLAREDIRWSAESMIAQMGAIGYVVSSRARFADLVLLPQPYAHPGQPEAEAVLEATLLEAAEAAAEGHVNVVPVLDVDVVAGPVFEEDGAVVAVDGRDAAADAIPLFQPDVADAVVNAVPLPEADVGATAAALAGDGAVGDGDGDRLRAGGGAGFLVRGGSAQFGRQSLGMHFTMYCLDRRKASDVRPPSLLMHALRIYAADGL